MSNRYKLPGPPFAKIEHALLLDLGTLHDGPIRNIDECKLAPSVV